MNTALKLKRSIIALFAILSCLTVFAGDETTEGNDHGAKLVALPLNNTTSTYTFDAGTFSGFDDLGGSKTGFKQYTYYDAYHLYAPIERAAGNNNNGKYLPVKNSGGVGFRLPVGTYKFTIVINGSSSGNDRGVALSSTYNYNNGANIVPCVGANGETEALWHAPDATVTKKFTIDVETEANYWFVGLSGGESQLYSFTIEKELPSKPELPLIDSDYIWNANGDLPVNGYFGGAYNGTTDKMYYYNASNATTTVSGNSVPSSNHNAGPYTGYNFYAIGHDSNFIPTNGIGFKVDSSRKGWIRLYYMHTNPGEGHDANSMFFVQGLDFTNPNGDNSLTTAEVDGNVPYLTLFEKSIESCIDTDDDEETRTSTIWITGNASLISIEILYDDSQAYNKSNLTALSIASDNNRKVYVDAGMVNHVINRGYGDNNKNYLLSKDLVGDNNQVNGHYSVPLTKNEAIGIKIPNNTKATVTIDYRKNYGSQQVSDPGFKLVQGNTYSSSLTGQTCQIVTYENTDNVYTHTFDAVENTSGQDMVLWIAGLHDWNAYLLGSYSVALEDITPDVITTTEITDDYIWVIGDNPEQIAANSTFGGGYLGNNASLKLPDYGNETLVNGILRPTYNYSADGENISLKIADGLSGEVRVYYIEAYDKSVPVTSFNAGWGWDQMSSSGNTVTFSWAEGGNRYPAIGWLVDQTNEYSSVTVKTTSQGIRWQILLNYTDGTNEEGGFTPNTSTNEMTATINQEKVLNAVLVQVLDVQTAGTQSITFESVTLSNGGSNHGVSKPQLTFNGAAVANLDNRSSHNTTAKTMQQEATDYVSMFFDATATTDRTVKIEGGLIAGVEVLVWHEQAYDPSTIVTTTRDEIRGALGNNFEWHPVDVAGPTITGDENAVLNGNRYVTHASTNRQYIRGTGEAGASQTPRDLAMNATKVMDNNTVIIDQYYQQIFKLEGHHRYEIHIYWEPTSSTQLSSIKLTHSSTGANGSFDVFRNADNSEASHFYQSHPDSKFIIDLMGQNNDEFIAIQGANNRVYYSGFTIKVLDEDRIYIDTDVSGMFLGMYGEGEARRPLIYCTDNGISENFYVPKVYYVHYNPATGEEVPNDITGEKFIFNELVEEKTDEGTRYVYKDVTYPKFTNLKTFDGPGTMPISLDISEDEQKRHRVVGFEDTDNDRLYKVTYKHLASDGNTVVEDYYYLWFANYLKVGWWVNRDAKLIVGSNESYTDPDHLIVGEFYVSSGSQGRLLFDVVNPDKIRGETVDLATPWNSSSMANSSGFERAEWSFTRVDGRQKNDGRDFDATKIENTLNDNNNSVAEDYSWTEMNDHSHHIGDMLRVDFPSDAEIESYWKTEENYNEVVMNISLTCKRKNWPEWSVKLIYHFVRAPKVEIDSYTVGSSTSSTYTNTASDVTVKMTGYNGNRAPIADANAEIFYTTDGTTPTIEMKNGVKTATNATYKYDPSNKPNTKHTAVYYAAEMIRVPRPFYKINPFTTYYAGSTFAELVDATEKNGAYTNDNISYDFIAVSKILEAKVNDPLVEYLDDNVKLVRDVGEESLYNTNISLNGDPFIYTYPYGGKKSGEARQMNVMFGTKDAWVYRNNYFKKVGVKWSKDGNTSFEEHMDAVNFHIMAKGSTASNNDNGNPHTECNLGLGGVQTENGGLFLHPVGGDFLRFEPEYDGVITVWMRTNGAAQSDEKRGNITRRPVYIVDENGVVMPRSTIKPTVDYYYSLNGTYGEINSLKSTIRQDSRIDWVNGLRHWKWGYTTGDGKTDYQALPVRNMATFNLYNYWYGFQLYQHQNTLEHYRDGDDVSTPALRTAAAKKYAYKMDVADSWVSRTAMVQSVVCPYNSLLYHSKHLHDDIEMNEVTNTRAVKFLNQDGTAMNIYSGDRFALYGYEVPAYNIVRYRFPVKAGKSYYMGGRGTKNGFVATKFEPLEANYSPASYNHVENRLIEEESYSVAAAPSPGTKKPSGTEMSTYDSQLNTYTQFVIDAKTDATNSTITSHSPATAQNAVYGTTADVLLKRDFEDDRWYAIVLPFSVSETRMRELFGAKVKVLYLDPYDQAMITKSRPNGDFYSAINPAVRDNKLTFTYHYYQMLYANVPAFICPSQVNYNYDTNGDTKNDAILFQRVTIDKSNLDATNGYSKIGYKIGESRYHEFWVRGSYAARAANSGEMYYLDNVLDVYGNYNATIFHSQKGVALKPTRCWIEVVEKSSNGGNAPERSPLLTQVAYSTFDGEEFDINGAAGINDIVMDDTVIDMYNDNNVYDLLGRVVAVGSLEGLPQGVYMFHGQKVYVR